MQHETSLLSIPGRSTETALHCNQLRRVMPITGISASSACQKVACGDPSTGYLSPGTTSTQ